MKIKELLFSRQGKISSFTFLFTILPLLIVGVKVYAFAAAISYTVLYVILTATGLSLFGYTDWNMGQQIFPFLALFAIPWTYILVCVFTKRFNDAGGFHPLIYIIVTVEVFHVVKTFLINFNYATHINCGHLFVELMLVVFAAAIGKSGHPFIKSLFQKFNGFSGLFTAKPKPIKVPAKYK